MLLASCSTEAHSHCRIFCLVRMQCMHYSYERRSVCAALKSISHARINITAPQQNRI